MKQAETINESISTRQAAEKYGLEPDRAGFISCPFHSGDRTPSLKVYDEPGRGFYCFGCGAGGDVIKFTELLFNINFPQAVQRIKTDFLLRISSDPDEEYKWQIEKRKRAELRKETEQKAIKNAAEHCRIVSTLKLSEPMGDEWTRAAHELTLYGLRLEEYMEWTS